MNNRLQQLIPRYLLPPHLNGPPLPGGAGGEQVVHHHAGVCPRGPRHLPEVGGRLHFAHRLHEGVPHYDVDIRSREPETNSLGS